MGDLPHPPKLKLTPRNRAFLAGELYPPDEPYEQPMVEERRQRNLKGIADARAALHAKKPYKEGTEGMWALAAARVAGGAVAKQVGTKTGSSLVGRMAGSAAASGVNDMLSGDHRSSSSGPPQSAMGINAYNTAGTEGQEYFGARKRYDPDKKRAERNRSRQRANVRSTPRKALIEQREADEEAVLAEEEMRDFETGRHHPDRRPVEPFDEEEQKLLAESTEEDAVVWRSGNATPDLVTIEGLEDLEWEEVKEAKPLYDEGVAGQWFYNVAPSPVDYFKDGTHGQIYGDYGTSGFAQPAVSTPKQAGPPPPGATSKRPVEDKPPTLSSRSYFASGTQGQPMPRDRSNRDRTGEADKRRVRNRNPRTDKTTPFDTMTREELMRYREEEAQRMRDEK